MTLSLRTIATRSRVHAALKAHDALRADMTAATPRELAQRPDRDSAIALHLLALGRWRASLVETCLDGVIADLLAQRRKANPARRPAGAPPHSDGEGRTVAE